LISLKENMNSQQKTFGASQRKEGSTEVPSSVTNNEQKNGKCETFQTLRRKIDMYSLGYNPKPLMHCTIAKWTCLEKIGNGINSVII